MSYPQATSVPTSQMNDGTDDDTAAAVDFSASTSSGHGADMPENTHGNTESGKLKSRLTCNKCGETGHLHYWTDRDTGKPMCMLYQGKSMQIPGHYKQPIAVSKSMQQLIVSAVCAAQPTQCYEVTKAAVADIKQLSGNSTGGNDDAIIKAAKRLAVRDVRHAVFQACLPHAELLSLPAVRYEFIDNLVQKLLPTYVGCSVSKDTDLRCEAFTLADGQATKLKTPETPACTTETAFVQKSDAPLEHAADSSTPANSASDNGLTPGYLPVSRDMFEHIQAELLFSCTADAYATQQTSLCATYYEPHCNAFANSATATASNEVYWLNCPRDRQTEYLTLYRKAKQSNPYIGACVLLPFKLPLTTIDLVKGFKLIHTYARNTVMFTDPATGAPVRSKCTLALWYDPPEQTASENNVESSKQACEPTAKAKTPLKPRLQVKATVAGVNTLALLDSGAADFNYISEAFCKQHGVTTKVIPKPFSAVGIQNGSGAVTHAAKLTLKLNSFTCQAMFHVIDMPASASFSIILGDSFLTDTKAVLDYSKNCCVLHRCHRKHVVPFAAVSDSCATRACAADNNADDSEFTSTEPAPSIIGYAQAKRLLKGQCWHAMVIVRNRTDSDANAPVSLSTTTALETDITDEAVHPSNNTADTHQPVPDLLTAEKLQEIVSEYPDVFTDAPPYGGSQIQMDHEVIPVEPDSTPVLKPMYRYSPAELELMETRIAELLELGYIQPSASPYGAPVLFVKKPRSTELRMVVDYRSLNKLSKRNAFPLPRIDVLFDHLSGSKVFSLIDLRNAYHQCKLLPGDVPKTAFRTPFGHYEYLTLSFGLMNAPAAFQSVMNRIFGKLLYKCCLVYLDDILVFSKSATEHAVHLKAVLDILKANRLTVALHKCSLNKPEILFLGHIISGNGIATDPTKVAALQNFPVPTDVHKLRSFLGTCNYFRRFIRKYAEVVRPLTDLLKQSTAYEWSSKCQTAFDNIKHLLTTAPVLALPDWRSHRPFTMVCDASIEGVGGVLMQDDRPIAFESRKLNQAETHYSPTELEMLAVVHCSKVWRCYIEGRDVYVYTDHKPNITFDTVNMANRRHARWLDALQGHQLIWNYVKGPNNIADSFSRNPVTVVIPDEGTCLYPICTLQAELTPAQKLGESLSFMTAVKSGYAVDPWYQDNNNIKTLQSNNGLFFKDDALALPAVAKLQHMAIAECHSPTYVGHTGVTKTLALLKRYFWWPIGMATAVKQYVGSCDSCQRNKSSNLKPGGLLRSLPVPEDTWQSVGMDMVTDLPVTTDKGYDSIVVFIDRLSKMVRLAPCHKSTNAEQFAELFFNNVFRSHGLPEQLVHDRASIWTSKFWQAFEKLLGMSSAMTSGYRPQTNGNTERVNRIMEDMLRHFIDASQTNWDTLLPLVEFAINDSWHESIQATPFEVNYGKRPRLPLDNILKGEGRITTNCDSAAERAEYINAAVKSAKAAMQAAQQRQKHYADTRLRVAEFTVGNMVFLSTTNIKLKFKGAPKLLPKWLGPFKVTAVINPAAYKLELPASLKLHNVFHVSLLKLHKSGPANATTPPPPPELIEGEYEYEVESILSHRFLRNNKTEFLVKWLGYGPEHNTWEPEANCAHCPDKLTEYWQRIQSQQANYKSGKRAQARKRKVANTAPDAADVGLRRSIRRRF